MNSTCPNCGITYRIDPAKIPSGGVRARCTKCDGVFRVSAPIDSPTTPASPDPELVPPPAPPAPEPPPEPTLDVASESTSGVTSEPGSQEPGASGEQAPATPAFGAADPHRQARRLARALISDIVVYHPDRRERSLAAGTLRQDFRDEIRKSWDEYVGRVGESLARQTPYFREALNEILAGGSPVF